MPGRQKMSRRTTGTLTKWSSRSAGVPVALYSGVSIVSPVEGHGGGPVISLASSAAEPAADAAGAKELEARHDVVRPLHRARQLPAVVRQGLLVERGVLVEDGAAVGELVEAEFAVVAAHPH